MVEVDTVLLKIASRCNLDCNYCYVYHMGDNGWATMPTRMSDETTEVVAGALGDYAKDQKRPFAVVLHGGEPLLVGHLGLSKILSTLRRTLSNEYPISIQTNGVLISQSILDACSEHRVGLSVSIDGPKELHDRNRLRHSGEGSFDGAMNGIKCLRNHVDNAFLFAGLLAVIEPESEPEAIYRFLKGLGAPSIDFLYRDGNHSRLPPGKASFHSTEYGTWLSQLLEVYIADLNPPRVRLLDDMIKLTLGGNGTKEGIGVTDFGILIVDTDGSIAKNDTLKSAYKGADRFEHHWSVHTHSLKDVLASKEFASYHAMQRPSADVCRACPELEICGGGMTLHRWSDEAGYDNPSVYCTDQRLVIGNIRRHVESVRNEF